MSGCKDPTEDDATIDAERGFPSLLHERVTVTRRSQHLHFELETFRQHGLSVRSVCHDSSVRQQ